MITVSSFLEIVAAALVAAMGAVGFFQACLWYRTKVSVVNNSDKGVRAKLDNQTAEREPSHRVQLPASIDQFRSELERPQRGQLVPCEEFLGRRQQSASGNRALEDSFARAMGQG